MKKPIILWTLIAIAIIAVGAMLFVNKKGDVTISPSSSPLPSESPNQSIAPTPTSTPKKTTTATPGIKAEEVNSYEYLFNRMDPENRVFGIYAECQLIIPSNLTHKNNTEVMLDNTRSTKDHTLKIGDKEYALKAGEWRLVTLSSPTIPIAMKTFCEGIELGQIDLE
jgi:hypothetical protein